MGNFFYRIAISCWSEFQVSLPRGGCCDHFLLLRFPAGVAEGGEAERGGVAGGGAGEG